MTESRKRIRSDEGDFGLQRKYFVNEQLVNQQDQKLMKNIYEKTLNMIFAGAKLQNEKLQGQPSNPHDSSAVDLIDDKPSESQGCKLCWKDVDSTSNLVCKNCNLKMCSSCCNSCVGCHGRLCTNCVNIFGCSFDENAMCEDCKLYVI